MTPPDVSREPRTMEQKRLALAGERWPRDLPMTMFEIGGAVMRDISIEDDDYAPSAEMDAYDRRGLLNVVAELLDRALPPDRDEGLVQLAKARDLIANYLHNEDGESEDWLHEAHEILRVHLGPNSPDYDFEAHPGGYHPSFEPPDRDEGLPEDWDEMTEGEKRRAYLRRRVVVTGPDIEAAITRATPLNNPRLSEVDWNDVAAALATADEARGLDAATCPRHPDHSLSMCVVCYSEVSGWPGLKELLDCADGIAQPGSKLARLVKKVRLAAHNADDREA